MSNNQPVPMTYETLAAVLRNMADLVEKGDSLEGSIEYLLPEPPRIQDPAAAEPLPDVMVRASYRIGNLQGQGGMRIIGTLGRDGR